MALDWGTAVLAALVMALGALVQGAAGFGSALVAAPLLALLDPAFVPGPIILAIFALTLLVVRREHRELSLHAVGWAVAGRVPGTGLGVLALVLLPATQLSRVFAVLVLLAVGTLLLGRAPRRTRATLFGAGLVSGVMGTVTSIGGPPMALMFHDARGPELRGTLGGYFIASTLLSLTGLGLAGRLGVLELQRAGVLLPGILLGFWASSRARHWLDRGYTRTAVLTLASLSALGVLWRSLV